MDNKELVILAAKGGGPGGSVSSVNGQTGAVVLDPEDVGAAPAETTETVSGTTPTITPAANTVYECGELSSLTVSNPPAVGEFEIDFTSGATATTCTWPDSWQWNNGTVLTPVANTDYQVIVKNGKAVVGTFPIPEVTP